MVNSVRFYMTLVVHRKIFYAAKLFCLNQEKFKVIITRGGLDLPLV